MSSSTTSTTLGPARAGDLPAMARLHVDGLPNGFFPRLGERFLAAYHATFVDGPFGVATVARRDGEVVGVVVGSTGAGAHSSWTVRHRGVRLAVLGACALLLRPAALATFLRTRVLRYLLGIGRRLRPRGPAADGVPDAGPNSSEPDVAVLHHVVVDEAARGQGLGAALVTAFVEEARDRGARSFRLVTKAREGASGLYERLGWSRGRERRTADGTLMVEYVLALPAGEGPRP